MAAVPHGQRATNDILHISRGHLPASLATKWVSRLPGSAQLRHVHAVAATTLLDNLAQTGAEAEAEVAGLVAGPQDLADGRSCLPAVDVGKQRVGGASRLALDGLQDALLRARRRPQRGLEQRRRQRGLEAEALDAVPEDAHLRRGVVAVLDKVQEARGVIRVLWLSVGVNQQLERPTALLGRAEQVWRNNAINHCGIHVAS